MRKNETVIPVTKQINVKSKSDSRWGSLQEYVK
jgi:hypothetical protein